MRSLACRGHALLTPLFRMRGVCSSECEGWVAGHTAVGLIATEADGRPAVAVVSRLRPWIESVLHDHGRPRRARPGAIALGAHRRGLSPWPAISCSSQPLDTARLRDRLPRRRDSRRSARRRMAASPGRPSQAANVDVLQIPVPPQDKHGLLSPSTPSPRQIMQTQDTRASPSATDRNSSFWRFPQPGPCTGRAYECRTCATTRWSWARVDDNPHRHPALASGSDIASVLAPRAAAAAAQGDPIGNCAPDNQASGDGPSIAAAGSTSSPGLATLSWDRGYVADPNRHPQGAHLIRAPEIRRR